MSEGVNQHPLASTSPAGAGLLAATFRSHRGALFRRAMKFTHRHADAWDLVQETLLRALVRGLENVPADKVCNWLFVVMNHLHVDHRRKASRCPVVSLEGSKLPPVAPPQLSEKPLWQTVEYEDVRQCLPCLDPRVRAAYVLHDEEGLSLADTASRLRVPVATAGTRVFRARRKLRAMLSSP